MTGEFFCDRFPDLTSFLLWFSSDAPLHYHGMQPDAVAVAEFMRIEKERLLLRVLADAKQVLALPEFPAEKIINVINLRRFEGEDVRLWFLSMLKLLEQEAEKSGYAIPDDLKGLWIRKNPCGETKA